MALSVNIGRIEGGPTMIECRVCGWVDMDETDRIERCPACGSFDIVFGVPTRYGED